jgi:hypothetical protein
MCWRGRVCERRKYFVRKAGGVVGNRSVYHTNV